ncbi:hypothetical protein [Ottowia sp.]|uniref:hypothetical protein n=1 Tax=Ottowia sp. TaxID=1898956 RepID=UPI0025FD2F7F|nr:hypothetical protein [Ottowia sp.]MBK6616237.1 hypothetical protein [Ottowia sp.]
MATYAENDIKHETDNFWVLAVGRRGFEVYVSGCTHSTRVASIGNGDRPGLGLKGAIAEADRRQAQVDEARKTGMGPAWLLTLVHRLGRQSCRSVPQFPSYCEVQ